MVISRISKNLLSYDELRRIHNSSQNEATDTRLQIDPTEQSRAELDQRAAIIHYYEAALGKYDPHRYYSPAVQHLLYES